MIDKLRYILKLLIIVLLNICVIGAVSHTMSKFRAKNDVQTFLTAHAQSEENSMASAAEMDHRLLAQVIFAEGKDEPYLGQVAVGAVILNRVQHPSFPDSLAGVIYQPGAFNSMSFAGANDRTSEGFDETAYRAAKEALNGFDPSGGSIYYYNPDSSVNEWLLTRPVVKIIGKYRFCS